VTRIADVLSALKTRQEGGLIAYVTAGHPSIPTTIKIVRALVEGGSDIIELGIPFSDPIADGPTIQAASVHALKRGTTPRKVLSMVNAIKKEIETPLILLTYYNPIFKMGISSFFESAHASGVDGIIVPDLPIEEAQDYKQSAVHNDIDTIFLATPSTTSSRIKDILEYSSGFLYLVSIFGVTGARKTLQRSTLNLLSRVITCTEHRLPVAVGFGLSHADQVRAVIHGGADAAIVGSAFVQKINDNHDRPHKMLKEVKRYCQSLKAATRTK